MAHGQTLSDLLNKAETNGPLIAAKRFEENAAADQVRSTRNATLPSLDAAYQLNYATYNNITGMAAPQYFIPISGPPSVDNQYSPVFGSAASLLMNWDILTFGQRNARTDIARANQKVAAADTQYEILRTKVTISENYLDVLFAGELIKVFQKNLDRSRERVKEMTVLTETGLRPAVDSALFQAEVSRASIELLNAQKVLESRKLLLAEAVGEENISYDNDSGIFDRLPSAKVDTSSHNNPLLRLSQARVESSIQQRKLIQRTLYPKLSLWATTYARGSGIRYDGYVNSEDGLSFTRYNYGFGLQFSLPILRFIDTRTQLNQSENITRAHEERLRQARLQLRTQNGIADLTLQYAIQSARQSPAFYDAAKFAYDALYTRYNAGLANYADLVQAQYGLLKAESDLKKSYLEAWKALLYGAAVQGDLDQFLNQIGKQ